MGAVWRAICVFYSVELCINKDAWDLYPFYKKTFHIPTIKECMTSITHADGQQFTHLLILGAVLHNIYSRIIEANLFLL